MAWFSLAASKRRQQARQKRKEDKLAEKERKRQEKIGKKDVKYYLPRLTKACTQQGMFYILRSLMAPTGFESWVLGESQIQRVRFSHVFFDATRIWFRIDSSRLPTRTSILDFATEGFLATVSDAVAREVKFDQSPSSGTWLIIERDGSTAGIPTYIQMEEAFNAIPKDADELTVMLGKGEHDVWHYGSLTEWHHMLVAGQTGAGKSVWMNNAIVTLSLRNTPDTLRFMMVDLKGGVELGPYKKLPHLLRPIVSKPEEVSEALNEFIDEIARRSQMFEQAGVRNLHEWNQKNPDQKLPFIILLIDELSRLLLSNDKKIRSTSKNLLNDVLATARAFGMHVIACTQDPASEIVPRWLKTNLPAKLCFSMPSISASVTVLGNKSAYKLGVKGRGIFQWGDDIKIQGPYIGTRGVNKAVRFLVEREKQRTIEQEPGIGLMDLLRYSLENLDGILSRNKLLEHFQPLGIGETRIRKWLSQADGQTFELATGQWFLVQPSLDKRPRQLIQVPTPEAYAAPDSVAAD